MHQSVQKKIELRKLVHSQLEQSEECIFESFKTSKTDHAMRHHAVGVTDRYGILICRKMKKEGETKGKDQL